MYRGQLDIIKDKDMRVHSRLENIQCKDRFDSATISEYIQ